MSLSPVVKKAIKGLITEVSDSMTRIEAERDLIKSALSEIAEEHELDKKILRKMAKTYHKQRFHTEKEDNEKFEETYAEVFDVVLEPTTDSDDE